jgi:hypothetical protein
MPATEDEDLSGRVAPLREDVARLSAAIAALVDGRLGRSDSGHVAVT